MVDDVLMVEFARICALLFPDWVDCALWRVRYGSPVGVFAAAGFCEEETRTIWIGPEQYGSGLLVTLAHEIAHAVTPEDKEDHGQPFVLALLRAGAAAERAGLDVLAKAIREDAKMYTAIPYIRSKVDGVSPVPSFEEVLAGLKRDHNITLNDVGPEKWRLKNVYYVAADLSHLI